MRERKILGKRSKKRKRREAGSSDRSAEGDYSR